WSFRRCLRLVPRPRRKRAPTARPTGPSAGRSGRRVRAPTEPPFVREGLVFHLTSCSHDTAKHFAYQGFSPGGATRGGVPPMEELSRRKALMAGGALGALGVLGAAVPANARALWTWSQRGAVPAAGGPTPAEIWDTVADPVIASLLERGDVPKVNELLRTWIRNDQPLPDGLPTDVR